MKRLDWHQFDGPEMLAHGLAAATAERLERAIDARGVASLVVSGGRTPRRLFEVLSGAALDWSCVVVTLADERWVASDHADSNEALVRQHLLQGVARDARLVGMKTPAAEPEAGQAECQRRLLAVPRPFDVVLLGMGLDGHTASWFPDAPDLAAALDTRTQSLCVAVRPAGQPLARMSLTRTALRQARWVGLHIEGQDKRQVLERALEGADCLHMPVRALWTDADSPPRVYWCP